MLEVKDLVKSYDVESPARRSKTTSLPGMRSFAVNNVSFTVEAGEMFTLLGPSGCGKTTTLRSVAGLERPTSGTIAVAGRTLFSKSDDGRIVNVPANQRELGMVFQSYAIWPHMTVFDNVAFPLQVVPLRERQNKATIASRVERVLETMELGAYAGRKATKLSGGQQQRLALARAIVSEPELLLLDEPLSNLDAKLRESLRFELKRLQREFGITSVYVTHDQSEALALSSKIAVMKDGEILQLGKPRDVYERPADKFVAEFVGTSNFVDGKVTGSPRPGSYAIDTAHGPLALDFAGDLPVGTDVIISVRPESISVSTERPPVDNVWEGTVETRVFLGEAMDHMIRVGDVQMRSRSLPNVSIPPETRVFLGIDRERTTLVPLI